MAMFRCLNSNLSKNYVFKKGTFSSSNGYTDVNISGVKKVLAIVVSTGTSLGNSGIFGNEQTMGNFNGTKLLYSAGLGANNAYGVTELGTDKFVFRWDAVYTFSYIALCES